jgi:hypothetical protein
MTRTLKVPKEHQAYWPHSQTQFDKIPLIDTRLAKWKDLVEVRLYIPTSAFPIDSPFLSSLTLYSVLYSVHSKETTILNEFGQLKSCLDTLKTGKKVAKKNATSDLADNDITTLWQNFAVSNQKEHANWVVALNLLIQDIRKLRDEIRKRLKVSFPPFDAFSERVPLNRL